MSRKKTYFILGCIIGIAFIVRLIPALSIVEFPERFIRPDTPTYLDPARALLEGKFSGTGRAPGYTLLAAFSMLCAPGRDQLLLALAGVVLSTLTILPVFAAARELFNRSAALIGSALFAFNLTHLANAPMLLSDTFFGLFAALQFYFFTRFFRRKRSRDFLICIFFAAIGTLIRPINLPWIIPALFLLWMLKGIPVKQKIYSSLGAVFLTAALLVPWMARNAAAGAPWCIDTNTGAMVHQNGAMILAEANKSSYEAEKEKIRREYDTLFKDVRRFPDEKSREKWKMERFRQIITAHPWIALKQHFNWHRILLPDAPTFFEITGLTTSDRGTMNVLAKEGLFAAVNHYFDGRWYLPAALCPLLAVTGITYLGTLLFLAGTLFRIKRHWYFWLLFLAFAEFYLFLPGPICAPRYQIPALPVMCAFAGAWIFLSWRKLMRSARSPK